MAARVLNAQAYAKGCDDYRATACRGAMGVEGPQCPKLYANCCAFCQDFEGGIGCKDRCGILIDFDK